MSPAKKWKSITCKPASEKDLQIAFIRFIKSKYPDTITSSTGNFSSHKNAANNVRMGYSPGMPDVVVYEKRGVYAALLVELKVDAVNGKGGKCLRKSGTVSSKQKSMIKRLRKKGYYSCVAYGLASAKLIMDTYMSLTPDQRITVSK